MDRQRGLAWLSVWLLAAGGIGLLWWAGLPTGSPPALISGERPPQAAETGYTLPAIPESAFSGESVLLPPQSGKPLILTFWATWCPPCQDEMPILETLYRQGVPVIGINAGLEDRARVEAWLDEYEITFPNQIDDVGRTLEARFRVRGLPTTFFVDEMGIIRHIERGALTARNLQTGLAAIGLTIDIVEDTQDE